MHKERDGGSRKERLRRQRGREIDRLKKETEIEKLLREKY
jgi:hypothetical protein